jgi:hypothetical protein
MRHPTGRITYSPKMIVGDLIGDILSRYACVKSLEQVIIFIYPLQVMRNHIEQKCFSGSIIVRRQFRR